MDSSFFFLSYSIISKNICHEISKKSALIVLLSFAIISCSKDSALNVVSDAISTPVLSAKKTVEEPARCIRYGTNPYGEDNPKSKQTASDGTVILHYVCSNSQDICYHYGAANLGDDVSNLTAMQDNGLWYEAVFAGTTDMGAGLQDDQINILP